MPNTYHAYRVADWDNRYFIDSYEIVKMVFFDHLTERKVAVNPSAWLAEYNVVGASTFSSGNPGWKELENIAFVRKRAVDFKFPKSFIHKNIVYINVNDFITFAELGEREVTGSTDDGRYRSYRNFFRMPFTRACDSEVRIVEISLGDTRLETTDFGKACEELCEKMKKAHLDMRPYDVVKLIKFADDIKAAASLL